MGKKILSVLSHTEYGNLENIYQHLDQVKPPSVRQALAENRERAFENRVLMTIARDAPVALDLDTTRFGRFDRKNVVDLLTELEFFSVMPRIPAAPTPGPAPGGRGETESRGEGDAPADYQTVDSPERLEAMLAALREAGSFAFDTETTGLELRRGDRVISIGACRVVNARLLASDVFDIRVDPGRPIPPASTAIHGLTDADVAGAPPLHVALPRFRDYIDAAVLLAHNAAFDLLAIQPADGGVTFDMPVLDTLLLSRALDEGIDGHDLDTLAERYGLRIPPGARHTALGDARVTAELWLALLPRLEARGFDTLEQVLTLQATAFDREDASA